MFQHRQFVGIRPEYGENTYASNLVQLMFSSWNIVGSLSKWSKAVMAACARSGGADAEKQ